MTSNDDLYKESYREGYRQALIDQRQPKSKWIKQGRFGRTYRCEHCGNYLDFSGVNCGRGSANFCPNCGKGMEFPN